MNAHWKLIVGLVIGALVAGQAVSIRYVVAGNAGLEHAAADIQLCHDLLARANRDYQDLVTNVSTIRRTSLSPTDQRIVSLIDKSAAVQKDLIDADAHALAAVHAIVEHDMGKP
jgi:hypothetical protein